MTAWCVTLICYLKLVLTDTQCKVDVRLWPLADIPIALMSVRFLDFMALSAHARPPKTSYTLL